MKNHFYSPRRDHFELTAALVPGGGALGGHHRRAGRPFGFAVRALDEAAPTGSGHGEGPPRWARVGRSRPPRPPPLGSGYLGGPRRDSSRLARPPRREVQACGRSLSDGGSGGAMESRGSFGAPLRCRLLFLAACFAVAAAVVAGELGRAGGRRAERAGFGAGGERSSARDCGRTDRRGAGGLVGIVYRNQKLSFRGCIARSA